MAGQRNRIIELIEYIKQQGIIVNLGKNKARGNKGIFCNKNNVLKIDLSNKLEDNELLPVLIHEFAHYVHYTHDKKLKSLNFVFGDMNDEILEELINLTVKTIPKSFATNFFDKKEWISANIKNLAKNIKTEYPDFKISEQYKLLEKNLPLQSRFLLKYDKVKYFNKIYSIDNLETDFESLSKAQIAYFKIKSEQRKLKRINSRINRINKYYNSPTELFARFCEFYFTKQDEALKIAPKSVLLFEKTLNQNKIKELNQIADILKN